MRRVSKDQVGNFDGCRGRIDRTVVSRPYQERQPASMIQVSVSQDDGIQFVEHPFFGNSIGILKLAGSLKEAEVHEDVCLARLQQVSGPGDLASAGAMDRDLHFVV